MLNILNRKSEWSRRLCDRLVYSRSETKDRSVLLAYSIAVACDVIKCCSARLLCHLYCSKA